MSLLCPESSPQFPLSSFKVRDSEHPCLIKCLSSVCLWYFPYNTISFTYHNPWLLVHFPSVTKWAKFKFIISESDTRALQAHVAPLCKLGREARAPSLMGANGLEFTSYKHFSREQPVHLDILALVDTHCLMQWGSEFPLYLSFLKARKVRSRNGWDLTIIKSPLCHWYCLGYFVSLKKPLYWGKTDIWKSCTCLIYNLTNLKISVYVWNHQHNQWPRHSCQIWVSSHPCVCVCVWRTLNIRSALSADFNYRVQRS